MDSQWAPVDRGPRVPGPTEPGPGRSGPGQPLLPASGPAAPGPRRGRRSGWLALGATTTALATVCAIGLHQLTANTSAGSLASAATGLVNQAEPGTAGNGGMTDLAPAAGQRTLGGGSIVAATGTPSAIAPATSTQQVGVADINTVLGYQSAQAAGTGLVVTSSGEVLTNNHVIDGATSITVTVVSTGRTYPARVVGYDIAEDIAVLQLNGAAGLATARTASGSSPSVGDAVVGVGNAGGVGGTPSAAPGRVVAVGQTITASDQGGANAEQLTGLIETDAAIAPGDSGGPLYNAAGAVIGIDTAASAGDQTQAFAIPIGRALTIAAQIEAGQSSATVHIGGTAMLGVEVGGSSSAVVRGVLSGSPAARAGVRASDVITALAGRPVTSASTLSRIIGGLSAGQSVSLHWTDQAGTVHRATVRLVSGPAL